MKDKRVLVGLVGASLMLSSFSAVAQSAGDGQPAPTRDQCLAAHHSAQELKRSGELLESQAQLAICSSVGCPGPIISDCGQWISDLEQITPSMVFDVRLDGKQVSEFQISVDGTPVTDVTKAFKVNPGRHVVRAELPNFEPQEETPVLPEGQRLRLISFAFKSNEPASEPAGGAPVAPIVPPPPVEPKRPTPALVYPLLGLAVAGFGAFGVFSVIGHSKQNDLEKSCKPDCTDAQLQPMKRNYLIGDVSAGVGVAALLGAGIVYFTRPADSTSSAALSVRVGAATPRDMSSFAVSLERRW